MKKIVLLGLTMATLASSGASAADKKCWVWVGKETSCRVSIAFNHIEGICYFQIFDAHHNEIRTGQFEGNEAGCKSFWEEEMIACGWRQELRDCKVKDKEPKPEPKTKSPINPGRK